MSNITQTMSSLTALLLPEKQLKKKDIITDECKIKDFLLFQTGLVQNKEEAKIVIRGGILLTTLAQEALTGFQNGLLRDFDALVGETSCQLRAFKITELFTSMDTSQLSSKIKIIDSLRKKLITMAEDPSVENLDGIKIPDYLDRIVENESQIVLTEDEKFIILSHLLYKVRGKEDKSKTVALNFNDLIGDKLSLPKDELIEIVFKAKKELVDRSISYLQGVAKKINNRVFVRLFEKKSLSNNHGLYCSPCFFNIKALLEHSRREGYSIMLSICRITKKNIPVDKEPITALFRAKDQNFVLDDEAIKLGNKAVVVFKGVSVIENESEISEDKVIDTLLQTADLEKIILANAAAHPQYSGDKKNDPLPLFSKTYDQGSRRFKMKDELDAACKIGDAISFLKTKTSTEQNILKTMSLPVTFAQIFDAYKPYSDLKMFAKDKGFCKENPSKFFLIHIYANTVKAELEDKTFEILREGEG